MFGDTYGVEEGGGGGVVPILGGSTRTSSANWWTSNTWGGGSGQMAIRGAIAASLRMQAMAARAAAGQRNLDLSRVYSHVPAGAPRATVQTNVPVQVTKLAIQAAQVGLKIQQAVAANRRAGKLRKQQAQIEKKILKAERRAPVPTYQEIALTGLNMGPPIPGATYY